MQPSFSLRPLLPSDVHACAALAGLAFESDRHTQLKARSPTDPYDHAEGMKDGLDHWLTMVSSNAVDMTVAVDEATDEPLGWVVWGFRGFNSPEAEARRREESQKLEQGINKSEESASSAVSEESCQKGRSARERLEAYTSSDMAAWMRRLMPPGAKCMYICSIAVRPDAQGRGVGSALIRRGTDRADAEGVYCWVHASEDGAEAFAKHGFREVGRLELNLDEWNVENVLPPEGSRTRWGSYTFRYMKREAKTGT